ncbi:MAG TPA: hypothetical protein VM537_05795, partial [Anaerolineae bacterium]|nr:hypothetical protein [Anaerolineae bacterium]
MARDEYDCYFTLANQGGTKGYMLAKDSDGDFLRGSASSQAQDPFTQHISQEERWKRVSFGFKDGAGCAKYDGTPRYAWGQNVDARSGRVLTGAAPSESGGIVYDFQLDIGETVTAGYQIDSGGDAGVAVKLTDHTTDDYRTVGLLLKRGAGDYTGLAAFTVEIRADAGGTPAAVHGGATATHSIILSEQEQYLHYENRWEALEYFWLEISFPAAVTLTAGTAYWLCVYNNVAGKLHWAERPDDLAAKISKHNGAAWQAEGNGVEPGFKLCDVAYTDAFTRSFARFQGGDNVMRTMIACGPKVMYIVPGTAPNGDITTANSKADFTKQVTELIVYNNKLFAALGDATPFWFSTGTSATGVWAVHPDNDNTVTARCWAIHDNVLWKGAAHGVRGATDAVGAAGWGASVTVGDVSTPVCRLESHGGKLFAIKPEGLFEISYTLGYPGAGTISSNMLLPFRSDQASRSFLRDWHSGLYFPGSGGGSTLEYKSDVVSDAWRERFTDDVDDTLLPLYDPYTGRMMDTHGLTREMIVAMSSPFEGDGAAMLWSYDGRSWHPLIRSQYEAETTLAVFVESLGEGRGRLLYGDGFTLGYTYWPTWTDDLSLDSRSLYITNAADDPEIVLPEFDDDRPDMLKNFYQVRARTWNLTTGGTLDVWYRIDDGSWALLGTLATSPANSLDFPANTTGYKIQFKVEWEDLDDASEPMRLDSLDLLFQPLPDTITQHQIAITAASNIEKHNNTIDQRSAGEIAAELRALLEETGAFTYVDPLGVSHTCRAMSVNPELIRRVEADSGDG